MKHYDAVLFWLGGVLVPTLPEQTMGLLSPALSGHDFVHRRQLLRVRAEDVALGKSSPAAYCEAALDICQNSRDIAALERELIASTLLHQPLATMLSEIPAPYECWLVVDYPRTWYQQLPDREQIESLFPGHRIIFTEQLELLSMTPDLFYRLPQKVARAMQECIIIDADANRAVQSCKHGLASIFYVYLQRLKLELALQEIWQTDVDVMHPTSSERVKF